MEYERPEYLCRILIYVYTLPYLGILEVNYSAIVAE
jgi:hypothetical protein